MYVCLCVCVCVCVCVRACVCVCVCLCVYTQVALALTSPCEHCFVVKSRMLVEHALRLKPHSPPCSRNVPEDFRAERNYGPERVGKKRSRGSSGGAEREGKRPAQTWTGDRSSSFKLQMKLGRKQREDAARRRSEKGRVRAARAQAGASSADEWPVPVSSWYDKAKGGIKKSLEGGGGARAGKRSLPVSSWYDKVKGGSHALPQARRNEGALRGVDGKFVARFGAQTSKYGVEQTSKYGVKYGRRGFKKLSSNDVMLVNGIKDAECAGSSLVEEHAQVCVCVCMYTYIHIYTYMHTYMHTYIHTYIHTYMHTCIHTYIHVCIHTCICAHAYMHTYTHAHIHTYICIHTHIHMRTYTHTHIHSYTHTHTHTHMCSSSCRCPY